MTPLLVRAANGALNVTSHRWFVAAALVLPLCATPLAGAGPSTKPTTQPATKAVSADEDDRFAAYVRQLIDERDQFDAKLAADGVPDPITAEWAQAATDDQRRQIRKRAKLRGAVVYALTNQWTLSGYPSGIPTIPLDSLGQRADEVLAARAIARRQGLGPDEAKRWLAEDVDALQGEYSAVALQAIYVLVKPDAELHVDHPGIAFQYSTERCRALHRRFSDWLKREQANLTWNSKAREFQRPDGKAFSLPLEDE